MIIHRLTWLIKAPTQRLATEAQRDVSALVNSQLFLQRLEAELNRIISDNDYLKIDKLEVDLGHFTNKKWQNRLEEELTLAVINELAASDKTETKEQRVISMSKQIAETFFEFIQTGVIPAGIPNRIKTLQNWGEYLAENWQSEGLANQLKKQLENNPNRITKLVKWPLSPFFLAIHRQVGRASKRIKLLAAIDDYIEKLPVDVTEQQRILRKIAWLYLLDDNAQQSLAIQAIEDVLMDLSYEVPQGKVKKLQEHIQNLKKDTANPQFSQAINKQLEVLKEPVQDSASSSKVSDKLFVYNAGFVLVAPFLPAFFKSTELVENKNITDVPKALALMHYLHSGSAKETPADLALFKILLGIPLDQVEVPQTHLPPRLKREADALLAEMIEHWKALKSTSPDGLREAFLNRVGILKPVDGGYNLSVETKAQDALMAKLPWGIGIIKLPWMDQTLFVDWG